MDPCVCSVVDQPQLKRYVRSDTEMELSPLMQPSTGGGRFPSSELATTIELKFRSWTPSILCYFRSLLEILCYLGLEPGRLAGLFHANDEVPASMLREWAGKQADVGSDRCINIRSTRQRVSARTMLRGAY